MEELFSNYISQVFGSNLITVFIITVIMITSLTNFAEKQQISILYLIIYGFAFFRVTRIWICLILLLVATFAFLEYLTKDRQKLELITRFSYKLWDYSFLVFFQLHISLLMIALALLFAGHMLVTDQADKTYGYILSGLSLLIFILCEHRVITQSFKVKDISGLIAPFQKTPYYNYIHSEEKQRRFELLCSIEDKTYFARKKSYSVFSVEYIKLKLTKKKIFGFVSDILDSNLDKDSPKHIAKAIGRGYSTPEMQLIRTVGVLRGYEKYKYSRKVYEAVYSKIFLSSLYDYQKNNFGESVEHFRSYVLEVYFKTVLSKVKDARYFPLSSAFKNADAIEDWPMEALFVLCLGLSFRETNDYHISLYRSVVDEFSLDEDKIQEYADKLSRQIKVPYEEKIAYSVER